MARDPGGEWRRALAAARGVSMTELLIQQLAEDDAPAYRDLRLHLLQVSPDAYGTTYAEAVVRPLAHTAARLRAQSDPQVGFTLGAFGSARLTRPAPGTNLLGMVTVLRDEGVKTRHKAVVTAMGVAREARGKGIGRALMVEAIARARQLDGLEQLLLTVVLPNDPARHLYRSLGFVTYGIDERGLKLGDRYWDEVQMLLTV